MPSRHAAAFNHDDDAAGYDDDVVQESDPIRAGYDALLTWVASMAGHARSAIVDLGAGTGNLTVRLPEGARVVCVDVSAKMLALARPKLTGRAVSYVLCDVMDYVEAARGPWDAVVSTYALHHLEDDEKKSLIDTIAPKLCRGGVLAIGDLGFRDAADREAILAGLPEQRAAAEEEFFWRMDLAMAWLAEHGLDPTLQQFSDLSWGICARRP